MIPRIRSITFNHDKRSASGDALNLRKNKDFPILSSEYHTQKGYHPFAAYAINETKGKKVFIRVSFVLSSSVVQKETYQVKAKGGGVLGELPDITIAFTPGTSERAVDIELANHKFKAIGKHQIKWEWYFREQKRKADGSLEWGSWKYLIDTYHHIFIILDKPAPPWTNGLNEKTNAWVDLLDICCEIAAGCEDEVSAVKRITESINGDYKLKYDIAAGGPRYVKNGNQFDLSNWIKYVIGENPPKKLAKTFLKGTNEEYNDKQIVNCQDSGISLTVMCTVLGIPAECQLHSPFGYLNFVEPIGRKKCNNPLYYTNYYQAKRAGGYAPPDDPIMKEDDIQRTHFTYHVYTKLSERYYDACMKQWLPDPVRLVLLLVWVLLSTLTFGQASSFREQALGWLVNLSQEEYAKRIIDKSTKQERIKSEATPGNPAKPSTFSIRITTS